MADVHANGAYSTVAVVPSTPTAGLTLTLATGDGARFPSTGSFNVTICPASTQPIFVAGSGSINAEIARVASRSGDVLTFSARATEGTTARTVIVGDQIFASVTAKTLTDTEGGRLLACTQYAPGTRAVYATTSTTFVAVDTTNLTISFVAPASGNVLLRLGAIRFSVAGGWHSWGVVTHGTTTLIGLAMFMNFTDTGQPYCTAQQKITGLTPGTTYQWDWAHATGNASDSVTIAVQGVTSPTSGSPAGPGVMEVWAA